MAHFDTSGLEPAAARLTEQGIDVVRLGYCDLIGTDRGRDVLVNHFPRTVGGGLAFCRSVYGTTPRGGVVDIEGGLSDGLPDILAFPDVDTLLPIPWAPGVAHCVADLFNPDGSPSEESPRYVLRKVVAEFEKLGMRPIVGPELEFYVLERSAESPSGWRRYGEGTGNVYVAGRKGDPEDVLLSSLRQLGEYGIDVVAANHEFSSGQFEINLWHGPALKAADRAHRFKAAVKEMALMRNALATFMPKPFNDEGGSGYHLHFSAWSEDDRPLFDDPEGAHGLSEVAGQAVAGILAHAPAFTALANPTINSFKRFGPDTLAPWLIDWGMDNRSAMIRIPPERGRAARMELRLGDASGNPYLTFAALLAAVYLGIEDGLPAPDPLEGYGYDKTRAEQIPADLRSALNALEADTKLTAMLGDRFVDTFLNYKRNELERFASWVTDWEFREYAYHL